MPATPNLPRISEWALRLITQLESSNQQIMLFGAWYDGYRGLKLPIGTGAVEGSCKFVVQSRFKRPGTRPVRAKGLREMFTLKLTRLNGHWGTLWSHLRAA